MGILENGKIVKYILRKTSNLWYNIDSIDSKFLLKIAKNAKFPKND
jgi:hypothetical protein